MYNSTIPALPPLLDLLRRDRSEFDTLVARRRCVTRSTTSSLFIIGNGKGLARAEPRHRRMTRCVTVSRRDAQPVHENGRVPGDAREGVLHVRLHERRQRVAPSPGGT